MNIAIFGGAFDPFTDAHLSIVRTVASMPEVFQVYIEPAHDSYKRIVAPWRHRTEMIKCALDSELKVRDRAKVKIGFFDGHNGLHRQPYTIETLEYYSNIEGIENVYFVIGTDQLTVWDSWKEPEKLAKKYKWIVFERDNDDGAKILQYNKILWKHKNNFLFFPLGMKTASSRIRHELLNGSPESYDVPKEVMNYINKNNLYRELYVDKLEV